MKSVVQLAMKLALWALVLLALEVSMTKASFQNLNPNFYDKSCPRGQDIIKFVIQRFLIDNNSLAAALLRMHFHDCFVNGCDSSVMIYKSDGTAERDGLPNKNSLRGFEVIDAAKAAVEQVCPRTFSCADIIAQAARDSVSFTGGAFYNVQYGRRDGNISLATLANRFLPSPFSDYNTLVKSFAVKGLNPTQMAILSGAHTIGSASCAIIHNRLYNFSGDGDTDPSYDPFYAAFLKTKCGPGDFVTRQAMDPFTNGTFDSSYFIGVKNHKGFFTSDAALITNSSGAAVVTAEANNNFQFTFTDFVSAILAMGGIEVLTGTQGSIRTNCSDPHS